MSFTGALKRLLTVDDSMLDDQFSLADDDPSEPADTYGETPQPETVNFTTAENKTDTSKKPVSMRTFLRRATKEYEEAVEKAHVGQDDEIECDIDEMKRRLERFFHLPQNKDIVIREFRVGVDTKAPWRGMAVFVDGLSDKNVINSAILEPLMILTHVSEENPRRTLEYVVEKLLPGNQSQIVNKWSEAVANILTGSTVLFLDRCNGALVIETKGWEHRSVSTPQTENVVRGSQDAFTENFRANTGLVRARLRTEHLVTEIHSVGNLARTDVAIMYIHGVTNPKLVREVRRRISQIDVDFVLDSGMLEQFIEDRPSMLIPQVMATERPDRVAASLAEGYVALFVGNSTYCLIVPVVLWSLVHSSEDSNIRFLPGTFMRLIRWIALLTALLLPGLYVAVTNYHAEMLPTDLMLAIAGSREQVPFPVVVEVLLMEFAIELIREAGIRIPTVIGPTIGIVGALIIGQSAVQAGIVSPLLVIVVATTALASFTVPNYELSMGIRIMRFAFLIAGAVLGFYGIAILFVVYVVRLTMLKSFGVPILSPIAPSSGASRDVLLRGPLWSMNKRPSFLYPLRSWRQKPMSRPWSAPTRKSTGKEGGET
ncbi:spore germination protein [Alicyclobacillus hesperidum]|uniref:spore germination protein n=1 Tax=Alicyclobacillus hesperidum TaxID=89784 RepID=UPI000725834B|nr:spore germination protein [Alicyclobacillus hesperidum]KRW91303.1 spore gernimation protein GerA [Alicyclobacillus tengchongensis]